jgi:zinc protease
MLGVLPMLLACREPIPAPRHAPASPASRPVAREPSLMSRQPALGPAEGFVFPQPVRLRLPGGMRGLLIERHDLPLVQLRLVILSGTSAGSAFATVQMLDEGAGGRSALQLSSDLMQIGASLSMSAQGDHSTVGMQVLRPHLDAGLDILADVVLRPRFLSAEWKRVRGELLSRASQRRSQPAHVAQLGLKRVIYGAHPYGRPTLPLPAQLEGLRIDELRSFHRQHYRPDNVIFVVAGAVSATEIERRLASRFGGWRAPRGRSARAARVASPPSSPQRLALADREGASQSVLRVGELGPARRDVDYAALRLLSAIFGGSFTCRLNQNLREKHGFTYGARASFSLPRQAGMLAISASVDTKDTTAALREIFRELQAMRDRRPTRAELDKARQLVIEELPALAETLDGLVGVYGEIAALDLPLDTIAKLPEEVAAVSAERVQRLARELLHPARASIVVVGDLAKIRGPLQQVYGKAKLLDADGQ